MDNDLVAIQQQLVSDCRAMEIAAKAGNVRGWIRSEAEKGRQNGRLENKREAEGAGPAGG